MGLSSVMQTALSGMAAAELTLGVVANNLANANTPGFKASSAASATQTPRTAGHGAAPSGSSGGSNPVQIGSGVRVAAVSTNTDLGQSLIDLSQASILFRANVEVLATGEGMYEQLTNLTRPT